MLRLPVLRTAIQPYRPTRGPAPSGSGSASNHRAGGHGGRRAIFAAALAAAAVLAASLGGCGLTQSPTTRIGTAQLVDRSSEALRFDVAARLRNPNPEDSLELRTIRYTVRIDGGGTYRGLRAAQATLAPGSDATLELPVIVPLDEIDPAATGLDWSIEGALLYIAPGALAETLLDAGVRRPTIRFRGSGRVALIAGDGGSLLPAPPLVGPEPQDTD